MELFTDEEWKQAPITLHGKVQRYQVNVEARLDEDEEAVEILNEQLLKPVAVEKDKAVKKEKSWWQFWK